MVKFLVTSKYVYESYYKTIRYPYIIIGIGTTEKDIIDFSSLEHENRKDYLSSVFADISHNTGGYKLFSQNQAKKILKFVDDNIKDVGLVICQCEAGISRSSGVAAALSKIYLGDDSLIFNDTRYNPNMHVYRTMLNTYHNYDICKEERI